MNLIRFSRILQNMRLSWKIKEDDKMKKDYISPEMEIILFTCSNVICSSTDAYGWYTPGTELPSNQDGVGTDGWE